MRLPDPLLESAPRKIVRGQVRKSAKRSGREPGVCGFDSHLGHSKSGELLGASSEKDSDCSQLATNNSQLSIRSRRPTATTPGLHPGDGGSIPSGIIESRDESLESRAMTTVVLHVSRLWTLNSRLETGLSFNGRMPALQASDPGSIPGGSTEVLDPVVQRRRRLSDIQESDGSSPSGVTLSLIRKVAGYGWPDRIANAVLDER